MDGPIHIGHSIDYAQYCGINMITLRHITEQ
jgi:hypothetical protein